MHDQDTKNLSRIQREKREVILEAALEIFSSRGFRGTTIDQIAEQASLSKPNLLYYYKNKEEIYQALFDNLFDHWLNPLRAINVNGDPIEEILTYIRLKLSLSKTHPRESRLFANEVIRGCPRISDFVKSELKDLVDDTTAKIQTWINNHNINNVDPKHLLFSIWAVTQNYADFESQIILLDPHYNKEKTFSHAEHHLEQLFKNLLSKKSHSP